MLDDIELVESPQPISVTQSTSFVTFLTETSPTGGAMSFTTELIHLTRAVYLRTIFLWPQAAADRTANSWSVGDLVALSASA